MLAFMRKYPLASYFALALAISWGAVLAVILPGPVQAAPEDANRLFPFVYLAMLTGPSIAGVLLTWITGGAPGVRSLWGRLLLWRVAGRWYLVALLTAPAVLCATLIVLLQLPADFTPAFLHAGGSLLFAGSSPLTFILLALTVGVGAGLFEEIGWTGFATPRLMPRGITAILFLGLFWGLWHFLPTWWGSAEAFGTASVPLFMLVALFSFIPPYRILMTWVYEKTESLLIAVLMHASLTGSMLLMAPSVTGGDSIIYNLAFSGLLWVVVGIVSAYRLRHAAAVLSSAHPRGVET
jgi:CAAX protease family protein